MLFHTIPCEAKRNFNNPTSGPSVATSLTDTVMWDLILVIMILYHRLYLGTQPNKFLSYFNII